MMHVQHYELVEVWETIEKLARGQSSEIEKLAKFKVGQIREAIRKDEDMEEELSNTPTGGVDEYGSIGDD